MLDTIRCVHADRRYVPPAVAQQIATYTTEDSLTEREVAVLIMVADGKANKNIALGLNLSEDTIKAHLRSLFATLDVNDRTQAVTVALKRGIISL